MKDIINLSTYGERMYQRGSKAAYSGNYEDAIFYYKQAVKADPENVEYLADLASALNYIAHYEESIIYAARGLALTNDNSASANFYYLLGEAYMGISMFSEAYNMLNKSLYLNPNGQFAQDAEAMLYDLAEYTSNTQQEPQINDADYYFKLSAVEFQYFNGLYDQALKSLEDFESQYGTDAHSNALKIPILIELEQYQEALRLIGKQLRLLPKDFASAAYGLFVSQVCNDEAKYQKYEKLLLDADEYSENDLNLIANIFNRLQTHDLAHRFFLRLYTESSYDCLILHGMAAACYNRKDKQQAIGYWERVKKLEGGYGLAGYYLANINHLSETVSYRYAPTASQLESINNEIKETMAKPEDADRLYHLIWLALLYNNIDTAEELLKQLPADQESVQRVLKDLLLTFNLSMQLKLQIVNKLEEAGDKPVLINLGTTIAPSSVLTENNISNPVKKIEISERLVNEYTTEQLYFGLMSVSLLKGNVELNNTELSMAVELLICKKYNLPTKKLVDFYSIAPERYTEIEKLLIESGLIPNETV